MGTVSAPSRYLLAALVPLLWVGAAGAAPKPPTPSFAKACDGFASYDAQDTCDPTAKPGVVSFRDFILKTYPTTGDYGITRACNVGSTSEHKEGRAWDWKVNYSNTAQRDIAETVIDWLLETDEHGNACALARRLGMMYFIWNKQIWGAYRSPNANCSTAGWKSYTGTNPHTDHVHVSWAWTGAKKQTTWWTAPLPSNEKPQGYLDGASCERVWGWSQDPDSPKKGIDVHVYFGGPAGAAKAKGVPLTANVERSDLCTPLGSCNHGFEVASPLSLHDGEPHEVHAYGIDSAGGTNAELAQSPKTLKCKPVIPSGVRRLVVDATSFSDWGFQKFWDVMPVTDAALAAVEAGSDLPTNPLLVQADDGSPEIWLVDGELRRHVPSADVFDTWGFDTATVVKWSVADLQALPVGPDLRDRPVLVQGSGDAVYLMDDAAPAEPSSGGAGGTGGSGGGWSSGGVSGLGGAASGSGKSQHTTLVPEDDSGCACRSAAVPRGSTAPWALLGALALMLGRRRDEARK